MEDRKPDFSGWASRNDMLCADGRIIKHGAFSHQNGKRVPLVWMHNHKSADHVLGHVYLEDRDEGVYAHAFFNESKNAQHMKHAVQNGDINFMSIWANKLIQQVTAAGKEVQHGDIKEVSLVLAGANPGAHIENVILAHADGMDFDESLDDVIIHTGFALEGVSEEEESNVTKQTTEPKPADDKVEHAEDDNQEEVEAEFDESELPEILESFDERQATAVQYLVGKALADGAQKGAETVQHSNLDEGELLSHVSNTIQEGITNMRNVFAGGASKSADRPDILSHSEQANILEAARHGGSLKKYMQSEDMLAHFDSITDEETLQHAGTFGINDIDILFPDARNLDAAPQWLKRQTEWVAKVLGATKHVPFTRIKSVVADITGPEARARGYIKGTEKQDEVFDLLKRTTGPQTIYKKQKLDRDDILDINNFDVVAWLKAEIRMMLEEEIARAILVGDGRASSSPDKIKDPSGAVDGNGIRSIANDSELYAHRVDLPANVDAETRIDEITRARSFYRGSGSPTMYTTDAALIDMLLLKDKMGRRLYATEAELATVMRVKEIVTVEVMEDHPEILAIIVNLQDYSVGTDKGGDVTFFSDFDIDFNQEKYLMETRLSGALTRPKSAIVVRRDQGTAATPTAPSFDGVTNTITIPTTAGVDYFVNGNPATGEVEIEDDATVTAAAKSGHYIPSGAAKSWNFAYTA